MTPRAVAVKAGLERGWVELRSKLASPWELSGEVWPWIIAVGVMFALRDKKVPGTDFSIGLQAVPGIVGMSLIYTGLMGLALVLTTDRDDGTLLRMKAIPNGTIGYFISKVVSRAGITTAALLIILIPSALLFGDLRVNSVTAWLTLIGIILLGLLATLPIGAVIGAVFGSVQSLGLVMLPVMGLIAISGIFYPITAFPEWVQWIGQVFPVYWLGLGMRSALLPDSMAIAEIGGSWRHLQTIGVLGVWAVIGFAYAPVVLRRMARRGSGTTVKETETAAA
ncbi:ABC transporter permease [Kribbella sandramycini]|uniref:ABC transporter permease n=1 Tax=Kribbella sandramycini TaxID=60450 RepID=A0A7Y4NZ53_9ACTN|nr:ABC transporter permease [Kribbella sandramycini]MBB6569680.1 ABC-2 type transport system permease protein [Kribbella sandramycini]NOL40488.1 ABC transporter permease [Kribbella sandramycini]